MHLIGVLVVIAGAVLAGFWTWRRVTSGLYYRSTDSSMRPQHVSRENYEEWVIGRRKRWRLVKTGVGAAVGAAVAGLFIMIASGLRRG